MPGIEEGDLKVYFSSGNLTMKGEKKSMREEQNETAWVCERSYGRFSRTLETPSEIEEDKIIATYDKGVLTIQLPKSQTAQNMKEITLSPQRKASTPHVHTF